MVTVVIGVTTVIFATTVTFNMSCSIKKNRYTLDYRLNVLVYVWQLPDLTSWLANPGCKLISHWGQWFVNHF